jgi:hypothetical protein
MLYTHETVAKWHASSDHDGKCCRRRAFLWNDKHLQQRILQVATLGERDSIYADPSNCAQEEIARAHPGYIPCLKRQDTFILPTGSYYLKGSFIDSSMGSRLRNTVDSSQTARIPYS